MTNGNTRYLIDTNTLITPYKLYYPFDLAPNFWAKMKTEINKGSLILLDLVKAELANICGQFNLMLNVKIYFI